ncbi:glycosyltransferase family 2 protein [Loigolactobacillus rennini]|uniref:glycosyltransferase family 2 protein n=1 Tax=Loigolactobacillus rennini TaxID=238013 RepID=UPI001F2E86E4|nr:glycosyltransferase family 2 protein [Loigolactobacillus rennini]
MEQPLVSVIMPVYNSEQFVGKAIQSVQKQTYSNWELVITDDCSKDKTVPYIKQYINKDKRIKLFELKNNSGAAVARNTCLDRATGRFIAFLDSDDLWHAEKLDKQVKFMLAHDFAFTFTGYDFIGHTNKVISVPEKINFQGMLKNTIIGTLTVMIDKRQTGTFYMPLVKRGQDLLTWALLLKKIPYAYGLNESLSSYRVVKGSLSNNKIKAIKRTWHNYYYELQLGFFKTLYYFVFYVFNALKKHYS